MGAERADINPVNSMVPRVDSVIQILDQIAPNPPLSPRFPPIILCYQVRRLGPVLSVLSHKKYCCFGRTQVC